MSHPSDTLVDMRKTPLYQGKEQPLKEYVAGAATDIRRGSQDHGPQGAEGGASSIDRTTARTHDRRLGPQGAGGASNTEPRTGRALVPKHVQKGAGGASNGAHPADAGGNGRRGVDVDRRTSPSASVPVGAAGGSRKAGGLTSSGEVNGARPADAGGGGWRGVDVDRRKDSAFPVPLDAADGFRKVRGSDSNGLSSGVRPVDATGSGGRGWPAGLGARSGTDSISSHNSASVRACSGGSGGFCFPDVCLSAVAQHVAGGSGGSEGLSSPDLVSSIGSMQASVYIQMLFQYYLFLKCFQDLKAVHVFKYHCHTPLLFLES